MLVIGCRAIGYISVRSKLMATITPIRQAFGERVRELRTKRGYSQESLADAIGLHRTYIGAIERGEQSVSLDNIDRLAKTLKLDLVELFRGL